MIKISQQQFDAFPKDVGGGSPLLACPLTWIGISLEDEEGAPVPGARYHLVTPDGEHRTGSTGVDGRAFERGMPSGMCQVSFPDFDASFWKRI